MITLSKSLNWWFKAWDKYFEYRGVPNNAGDLKFRANMRIIWFTGWATSMAIFSGYMEVLAYAMVLWGTLAWYRPFFK